MQPWQSTAETQHVLSLFPVIDLYRWFALGDPLFALPDDLAALPRVGAGPMGQHFIDRSRLVRSSLQVTHTTSGHLHPFPVLLNTT
ncbi:hypothetical protein CGRA01v4_03781 [Colletotrichum graminicola]|nr:hypothetical protein CGRA01v4_03781 [Colletotrichum graminicola]